MIEHANPQPKTSIRPAFTAGRGSLIQRKCACGGSATESLAAECDDCKKKRLQTKLAVGASDDALEREAEQVAGQVTARSTLAAAPVTIRRYTGQSSPQADVAPASVDSVLASAGNPLQPALREDMEQRFGYDFSRVRVHLDALAGQSARDVNAHAYTVGSSIVFAAGRFEPGTHAGRRLLAHELTHVVQQNATRDNISDRGTEMAYRSGAGTPAVMRQAATPGVCDPANLTTLGPAFAKSEEDVKKLKLPAKLLRTVPPPVDAGFSLYCPHRGSSAAIGKLVAGTNAYYVGSGKVKGKHEVWARIVGHDLYYLGFIPDDTYENVESVEIPEDKISATPKRSSDADTKPKKGVCGPDVTKQLAGGVENVRKDFRAKSEDQREEMCDQVTSVVHGPVTWDFARLHVRNWMKNIRDTCATVVNNDAEACCANSVQVGDGCFYAGSANYVLFGAMGKLCFDHFLNQKQVDLGGVYRFRPQAMQSLIATYKSDAWNFKKSQQWTTAGYNGWPSGASAPAGDCSQDCSLTCPLPYFIKGGADNEAFRARWCPHIDPLGACKSWSSNLWDLSTRAKQ